MSYKIELSGVSKSIKGIKVLDSIDLQLEAGKIYGFQGKNGSGKTMLFRTICGLILSTEGEIRIDGEKLGKDLSFPRSVGILIEYPGFLSQYTGLKNLQIIASIKNEISEKEIKKSIAKLGLDPMDKRKYRKYSLGMKQRLGIAQAIMENPDILILDEPTNALDEAGVTLVRDLLIKLRNEGKTILIASHDKEELEWLVDEQYTMENGKIIHFKSVQEV
ncbi:ATP-binding cassette domain-containing protein [Halobacillus rhizosphaerae]|uniref:ATP-binding cassette domain-containing protein n=1 Tax=Halobacillus rhizosphaerae TaxID=3064889 RepID=UPI00398A953C